MNSSNPIGHDFWHWLLVGLSGFLWHALAILNRLGLIGRKYKGVKMQLAKPFDPAALIAGLKAKGIADAEQMVNDAVPTLFDWLNSSVTLEASSVPLLAVATPVLEVLEGKAMDALTAAEKAIGG